MSKIFAILPGCNCFVMRKLRGVGGGGEGGRGVLNLSRVQIESCLAGRMLVCCLL